MRTARDVCRYKGLGFRNVEAEVAHARYDIEKCPIVRGRPMNTKKIIFHAVLFVGSTGVSFAIAVNPES